MTPCTDPLTRRRIIDQAKQIPGEPSPQVIPSSKTAIPTLDAATIAKLEAHYIEESCYKLATNLPTYPTSENPMTAYWKTVLLDFDHPLLEAPDDLEREFHAWREMLRPDPAACHVLATMVRFMKVWKAFLLYGEGRFLAWCV